MYGVVCAAGWDWACSVRRSLLGLLYRPQMMMMIIIIIIIVASVDQFVEWDLAGETEVDGGILSHCRFVHHKSHMTWQRLNPDFHGGKPANIRLIYGTVLPSF
jgi:hypothetical protein